jgi:hypothetical protein
LSTDFEDIVFVLVNRGVIWKEMAQSEPTLKAYLQQEFTVLLDNPYFEEWIDAHSGYISPAAQAIVFPYARKFIRER